MKGQLMSASVSYFGLFNFRYYFSSGCAVQNVQGSGLLLWGDVHSTQERLCCPHRRGMCRAAPAATSCLDDETASTGCHPTPVNIYG